MICWYWKMLESVIDIKTTSNRSYKSSFLTRLVVYLSNVVVIVCDWLSRKCLLLLLGLSLFPVFRSMATKIKPCSHLVQRNRCIFRTLAGGYKWPRNLYYFPRYARETKAKTRSFMPPPAAVRKTPLFCTRHEIPIVHGRGQAVDVRVFLKKSIFAT